MQKRLLLVVLLCTFTINGVWAAKEIKYPISEIPAELKQNAKAVVRLERREFELKSENKATEKVTLVISILNENGLDVAHFAEFYNRFIQLGHVSASVYDENGQFLHRIKQEDIQDISATSGGTVYDDNRMKIFDPKTKDYPFTVEYNYEKEYNGIFIFPTWLLLKDYNISVEKALFRVISPNKKDIRIKQANFDQQPVITTENGKVVQCWEISGLRAWEQEPFSEHVIEYTPVIRLAPGFINFGGVSKDFVSWKDFGLFITELNKGRSKLPEETIAKLQELTKNANSELEKIQLVYAYMQEKTRYVSIQEGIGSWQPIPAEDVDRLGYGDCKALSNYMKSLLDCIGVKAYYTLVNAGSSALKMDSAFPCNQFNHAILCVPMQADTLWLECTSQHIPCGYISTFTDDRSVLLIDDEGGKVVRTKSYSAIENRKDSRLDVTLDEAGNATVDVSAKYVGVQYDRISPLFQMDQLDQKRYLTNRIDIPNFTLQSFQHQEFRERIPYATENLHLDLPNYGSKIGNRMIVSLNVMNKQNTVPIECPDRGSDVVIRRPMMEIDTVVFTIPDGYQVEKVPEMISLSGQFGTYSAKATTTENRIIYTREFKIDQGYYPPETYADLKSFIQDISKADLMKCLLVKR
jgi:hypothetical protein